MSSGNHEVTTPDGARLAVFVDGSGPDLLLISGLGGTAAFWQAVSEKLAERYRVIRLDQRGIGASSRGSAPCTIEQLAEDCVTVLDGVGSSSAAVLGHSTGGGIAMTLGRRAPERLSGLLLSATWARPNPHMQALFEARLALMDIAPQAYASLVCLMTYPPDWLQANWHLHASALERALMTPDAFMIVRERIAALLAFDGRDILPGLAMPCLVLSAEDDLIVPAYLQREIAEHLPTARLAQRPDGGHFYPLTRQDWFLDAIAPFLRSVSGQRPAAV